MGATAVVSSSATSSASAVQATVTSMLSPVGAGVGGVAVAITLVVVLGYLDIVTAAPEDNERIKQLLVAAATPLAATFLAIVAFRTLQLL